MTPRPPDLRKLERLVERLDRISRTAGDIFNEALTTQIRLQDWINT